MKCIRYYFLIVAIALWSCSTIKKQKQQLSSDEQRQVQVSARADSIQWNGHLGKWSFDVKAGRYEVRLDSSTQQKQRLQSSSSGVHRAFTGYVWQLLGLIISVLALIWGIRWWLKHKQT